MPSATIAKLTLNHECLQNHKSENGKNKQMASWWYWKIVFYYARIYCIQAPKEEDRSIMRSGILEGKILNWVQLDYMIC